MKQKQIFEISDSAALQISKASEMAESKDWPLRIAVDVKDGKFNYLMGFDNPKEEDLRLKINNIEILISPDSMINLKNHVLINICTYSLQVTHWLKVVFFGL